MELGVERSMDRGCTVRDQGLHGPWTAAARSAVERLAAARRVVAFAKAHDVDMRTAAYGAGLEHIVEVYSIRGIFP